MNTSKASARCSKNRSSQTSFMLPTSIYALSRSRQMKDLTDASKSKTRITIHSQKIYPVSNGEANQVSERVSSWLVEDDDSKMVVKPDLKNDKKVVGDHSGNQDSELSKHKSDSIDSTASVVPRKRVFPFEILLAVGEEVSKKQRLRKGMEMQEHEKAKVTTIVAVAVSASNKTNEANSKMQREKEREAARIALEKMERTTVIYDNRKNMEELEELAHGCSCNIFQTLGLVLKREYCCEEQDDEDMVDAKLQDATSSLSPKEVLGAEMLEKRVADTTSLKMRREKEREIARIALEKMGRTAFIYDNRKSAEELELLARGCPINLLQTLGLVLKREYCFEEGEEEEEEDIPNLKSQAATKLQAATTSLPPEQNDLRVTEKKKNDLRVEMLKKRFAGTILKAKQTMGETQQEKAEVSSIAGVAVAESKKSRAANSRKYEERPEFKLQHKKLKIRQQKEREPCRIAVQKIISKRKNKMHRCMMSKEDVEEGEIVC